MRTRRARTLVASIAAGAALLASPAIAHADPTVSGTINGAPITDTNTGMTGQDVTLAGLGCSTGTTGEQTYMGQFSAVGEDPTTAAYTDHSEWATDSTGSFSADITLPVDDPGGSPVSFQTRFYCATAPVNSLADGQILWVSPIYYTDIASSGTVGLMEIGPGTGGLAIPKAAVSRFAGAEGRPSSPTDTSSGVLSVDPDALPMVDQHEHPRRPGRRPQGPGRRGVRQAHPVLRPQGPG